MTNSLDSYAIVAIYSAMAIYVFAFVVFAFALAKRSAAAQAAPVAEPALATQLAGVARSASAARVATAVASSPTLAGQPGAAAGRPSLRLERVGFALAVLGWALHVAAVVMRGSAQGFVPWANMFEFSLTSSAIVMTVFIALQFWQNLKFLGAYITGFVLVWLGVGAVNFYQPVKPLPDALDSYWLIIHVFVAAFATALFATGAGLSILQLIQARREAGRRAPRFLVTLPDAVRLENLAYLVTVVGFVFWTFTLIAGSIWAERAWGRYWGWDTKEVWTFVIWVVYAGYIHARATRGWRGARSAWLAIIGFSAVIFNYTIVNLFFKGLHAYSGL